MTAYAVIVDLLLGNVPVPADAQKYLDATAEEIDSRIGFRYATPVVADTSPEQRPVGLLLKRINAWLATGRIILAKDAAGEDDQLHQYGEYLVREANKALDQIVDGTIVLPGVDLATPEASTVTGPDAAWGDSESLVEAFGTTFGSPALQSLNRLNQIPPLGNPYTW